jgi:hypothetical protein
MQKNVASQKWVVFAFDRTDNTPKTGDAANITANLRIDGGAANAVDDTNPTELEDGYYIFDITQAESNGENIVIAPVSSTSDIQVIGVPGVVYTTPANFPDMGIESDGDLTQVNNCVSNTDMRGTNSAATAAALATHDGKLDTVDANVDLVLADTADMQPKLGTPVGADMSTDIAAVKAETTLIVADTNELQINQGDWLTATGFATAAALATAQTDLDTITGADGVTLATAQGNYAPFKAGTMTESYAADGSTATPEQMLYMIWSMFSSFSISGTTYTAKKLDGSTGAMTFTLDDGTTPTAMNRAS